MPLSAIAVAVDAPVGVVVAAGPPPAAPNAPTNLAAVPITSAEIRLTWTDNSDDEDGFIIERSTDGVNFAQKGTVSAGVTTYDSDGSASGTRYYFRVAAYHGVTLSSYSNVVRATTRTLLDDLAAYFRLNEHGGTFVDRRGDSNMACSIAAKAGGIARFNGDNPDYLFHADSAVFSTGDVPFAWAGWVNALAISPQNMVIVGKPGALSGSNEYMLWYHLSANRFKFNVYDGAGHSASAIANTFGAASLKTWYFIYCYHDPNANTLGISVNNGTVDTVAYTYGGYDSPFNLFFGADGAITTNNLWGFLGPWGFWKGGLPTADMITSIYNGGSGKAFADLSTEEKANLAAWWDMVDTDGKIADKVGTSHLVNQITRGRVGGYSDKRLFAFPFDGTIQAAVADTAALSVEDMDFCWAGWVRLDATSVNRVIFIKGVSLAAAADIEYTLFYYASASRFRWSVSNSSATVGVNAASMGAPVAGRWYFIYVYHDAANNELGIQVNRGVTDTQAYADGCWNSTHGFYVGGSNGSNYLDGPVQGLGFWKASLLTSAELDALFNRGLGLDHPFGDDLADETGTLVANYGYSPSNVNAVTYRQQSIAQWATGGTTYEACCYWNGAGNLVIGKRVADGAWTTYTMDGDGGRPTIAITADADNHRSAVLGIDPNGYLHVAYDMSAGALKYRMSDAALDSWTGGMTDALDLLGTNETSVTYPTFFNDPSGKLYIMFRDGNAGNGDLYFYVYDESTPAWGAAVGAAGLLINGKAAPVNPYWCQPPTFDADFGSGGYMHLAWAWRTTADIYDLNYAKWNGTNWYQADGTSQTVPITTANCEQVEAIAAGASLGNGGGMFPWPSVDSDSDGHPHIAYVRYDTDGASQIFYTYHNGTSWSTPVQVTTEGSLRFVNTAEGIWNTVPALTVDRATDAVYIVFTGFLEAIGIFAAKTVDLSTFEMFVLSTVQPGIWNVVYNRAKWLADTEWEVLLSAQTSINMAFSSGTGWPVRSVAFEAQ